MNKRQKKKQDKKNPFFNKQFKFFIDNHRIIFLSNPLQDDGFYQKWITFREKEEEMTLQDLVNRINMYRRGLELADVWIHSRPSSSGSGKTLEIRCGGENKFDDSRLLSKSTHAGSLNWFLKGMLTAFQDEPAPPISNFYSQLAHITRSNYTRKVED